MKKSVHGMQMSAVGNGSLDGVVVFLLDTNGRLWRGAPGASAEPFQGLVWEPVTLPDDPGKSK